MRTNHLSKRLKADGNVRAPMAILWVFVLALLYAPQAVPAAESSEVYLPRTGPPPLRFQLPLSPDRRTQLPPLLMRDPAPPLPEPAPQPVPAPPLDDPPVPPIPEPAPDPMPPPAPPVQAPVSFPGTNAASRQPGTPQPPVTTQEEPLTPQVLLRFFNPGTNHSATVLAPFGFTPPAPGAPQSSRAVYSTGP